MSDIIDDLKVQIDASTQSADAKLDKFIEKMTKLQSTITGLEMSNVSNIASGINQISASIQGFNERTKTADFTRVATGLNKLAGVDAQGLSNASRAISTLLTNLAGLKNINFDVTQISSIAESVSKLGRISVTGATQNLEFLKTSLSEFIAGMNNAGTLNFKSANLVELVSSISKLGGKSATQSVKNLPQISNYLRQFIDNMNSIGSVSFDFNGLNSFVNNISRLGGTKATQATANLKPLKDQILRFVSGLNGIGALNFDTSNLANLVASIARLGGKAVTASIPNIQQLGIALKNMMATLSTAPAVSQNLIQMTNALAALASNGSRVSSVSGAMYKGLNLYSSGAKKAQFASHGLASAIGKVYATYWTLFRAFGLIRKAIDISSDLTEVQNVIDVSFGNMSGMVDDFTSNSVQKFGMSELTAKKMSGVFMAMGRSLGGSQGEMADMSIELTKLTADMASFYNVAQEDVGDDLRSVFTGTVRPLRDYGLDLTQANLQQYASTQGIEKRVAKMSQLEKVQLRYNYVMQQTASIQGDYQRTAGTWANQVRLLSQQFQQLGAIVGGTLINAFKPFLTAMNSVISKIISVAKAISNALGKIFGWKFEASGGGAGTAGLAGDLDDATGATDNLGGSAGGAADALGDAADNAKKLAGNLQSFDELNVVTTSGNSGGSGGSGGGGGDAGTGNYGEWVQGESILKEYESEIDSLLELGEYIGDTLIDAMNNIDWDNVYNSARNFGTGLADFMNGLISPELFGATGRTIAGSLNTALHFLNSYGETFDWKDFGNSIASGLNNYFSTFDFALAAGTLNTWANGILDTFIVALDNTDWSMIGTQIGTFLEKINFIELGSKIGEAIWKAINAGIEMWKGSFEAAPIETTILTAVGLLKFTGLGKSLAIAIGKKLFGGISLKSIGLTIKGFSFTLPGTPAFDVAVDAIIEYIEDFIRKNFGESVLDAMGEGLFIAISTGVGLFFGGPVGALVGGIIGLILDAFLGGELATGFLKRIQEDLFNFDTSKAILDYAKECFENAFKAESFHEFGINIVDGIINGLMGGIAFLIEPIGDMFDEIVKGICGIFGIESPAKEMEPYGMYILEGIIKGFKDTFGEWTSSLTEWKEQYIDPWFTAQKWTDLYNVIKVSLKTKWNETVGQWGSDISSWWSDNVAPWFTSEKWLGLYETVKSSLKSKWDETTQQWKTSISTWWNDDVLTWFSADKWSQGLSGIKTGFESAFNAAFDAVKTIWNTFAEWLNGKLNFKIESTSIMGKVFGGATINLGKIPTFATGGFPEDGLFMANHSELVGQFSNGKSVVANNEQITAGIAMAVRNANSEMISELRRQNELLRVIANKPIIDKGDVVDAWKSGAMDFRRQTGKQLGIAY